jgi:hypothetical protein
MGLNTSLCNWILDFLMGRTQVVRVDNNTYTMLILNTGPHRGVCSVPSLYSLFTHDSNIIIKFADDTTVVVLITDNNKPIGKRSET